jgi:hypothetical protein
MYSITIEHCPPHQTTRQEFKVQAPAPQDTNGLAKRGDIGRGGGVLYPFDLCACVRACVLHVCMCATCVCVCVCVCYVYVCYVCVCVCYVCACVLRVCVCVLC